MNRFLRSALALSILLAGLPNQAAAQSVAASARAASGVGAVGAVGTAGAVSPINVLGVSVIPAASLAPGLNGSLTPALVPAAAALSAPAISAPIDSALSVLTPAAVPMALSPVKAAAAIASPETPAAPKAALTALQSGAKSLSAAATPGKAAPAPEASKASLDALFEGSTAKPEALGVSVKSAPSEAPRLDPSSEDQGPRWVKNLKGPDSPAPKTSLKRTFSVGFLGAVVPIALTMVTVVVAQLFGYQLHPNYQGPGMGLHPSMIQALVLWVGAAIMAPVSEEAIFRGGLQGRLSKFAQKIGLGAFVVPAVITSLIFVALHETSDPVLFATRFVHAMILSRIYAKEGILASMAAHGFFNGLLALSIVLGAAHLGILGFLVPPLALWGALKALKTLKAQKPEIESGALAPKQLSSKLAFSLGAVSLLGFLFLMPNPFWALGAMGLFWAGIRAKREGR